jgi:hypothetical protein
VNLLFGRVGSVGLFGFAIECRTVKPTWAGYYTKDRTYVLGEVVVHQAHVWMARSLAMEPPAGPAWERTGDWIHLGKQENCKIDHYYHPEGIQVPLPSGEMSDTTYVCADCWKNCNFAAAFMPDEHRYLISELPG